MRIVLGIAALICLVIAGLGVQLVLQQQRQLASYSARTAATISAKRLKQHIRENYRLGDSYFAYEPIVEYRYEINGKSLKCNRVFPVTFLVGGNMGRSSAMAVLERYRQGQRVSIYYDPKNLLEACLLRQPGCLLYLTILLPTAFAAGLVGLLWPGDRFARGRVCRWIAAAWYLVGVLAAAHYFQVAGSDYSGWALALFGLYLQIGLIPVAFALPPTRMAKRINGAIGLSLFGTFLGFWLGLFVGWVTVEFFSSGSTSYFLCWGYGMAITGVLFFFLGFSGDAEHREMAED